jgi:hypothetical protein
LIPRCYGALIEEEVTEARFPEVNFRVKLPLPVKITLLKVAIPEELVVAVWLPLNVPVPESNATLMTIPAWLTFASSALRIRTVGAVIATPLVVEVG